MIENIEEMINIIDLTESVQCACEIPAIQDIACSTNDDVLFTLDDLMLIATDLKKICKDSTIMP